MGVCCTSRENIYLSTNSVKASDLPSPGKERNSKGKIMNESEEIKLASDNLNLRKAENNRNANTDSLKKEEDERNNIITEVNINPKDQKSDDKSKVSHNIIQVKNFIKTENASFIEKQTDKLKSSKDNNVIIENGDMNQVNKDMKENKEEALKKFNKQTTVKHTDFNTAPKIQKNKETVQKYYSVLNKLGNGSFGTVYKVIHRQTNYIRAMKVINKDLVKLQDDEKVFLKEIDILRTLDHMNIIKIYEYFEDDKNYYLITEIITGGELLEYVIKLPNFDEYHIKEIMLQIMSAVAYLHKNSITHRDLKPENILVDSNSNNDNINIKIIDFGTSNYFKKQKKLKLKVGSPYYIAPEVLDGNYNEKCDIWSCGCILYILLVGYPPFTGDNTNEIFHEIKNGKILMEGFEWDAVSDEAKDLVRKMLNRNYTSRISAIQCLEHPFLIMDYKEKLNKLKHKDVKKAMNNLKNFNRQDKLQQATIAYIVHFLTPANEYEQLKEIFKSIDKNGDGTLSFDEIRKGFEQIYGSTQTKIEMEELLGEIDVNGDGNISYEEFLSVMISKNKILNEKNLKACFEAFDENKDNKLSAQEIKNALGAKDNEYVMRLINIIDDNNNAEIDFDEFKILMNMLLGNDKDK